jgi:hypothetical protein
MAAGGLAEGHPALGPEVAAMPGLLVLGAVAV